MGRGGRSDYPETGTHTPFLGHQRDTAKHPHPHTELDGEGEKQRFPSSLMTKLQDGSVSGF